MVDAVNNLIINDSEYHESNIVTTSEAQGDLTLNLEIYTHNSNRNETITHTSNKNFEQIILSNRNISFFPPAMNTWVDQVIALNLLAT